MMRIGRSRRCNTEDVLKGMAAGAISGLAAAWVMNQFQSLLSRLPDEKHKSHGAQPPKKGGPQPGQPRPAQHSDEDDDATERAAEALAENIGGRHLTKGEKKSGGTVVHYAFGAATGAAYGALAEYEPRVTAGTGLPFGSAVWLAADEVAVPALGLSKPPWQHPLSVHASAFASHLVYGATAELLRRQVRSLL